MNGLRVVDNAPTTYVLDTSALMILPNLRDPFYANASVIIPWAVLEELDHLKESGTGKAKAARDAIKSLLSCVGKGSLPGLKDGAKLPNGAVVTVEIPSTFTQIENSADNLVIAVGIDNLPCKIVTCDHNLQLKAHALGVDSLFLESHVDRPSDYKGYRHVKLTEAQERMLINEGEVILEEDIYPNEFAIIGDRALIRKDVKKLKSFKKPEGALGIKPKNLEQEMAFHLLHDSKIKLVTLSGIAGSGKSLLAIAAALNQVGKGRPFDRIVILRPIVPMGNDIGFLSGSKDEKLYAWMQPIFDNLSIITDKQYDEFMASNPIEMEAVTYVRGRSFHRSIVIVDEAQNLTIHEARTVVTRIGEGSKIVLTGDPRQIDTKGLSREYNGLVHVIDKMKGQAISGHVEFSHSERSKLASIAASVL